MQFSSRDGAAAQVDWTLIQENIVEPASCDLLMILDCCNTGAAAKRSNVDATKGILAASGPDAPSWFDGHSYAKSLVRKLWNKKIPFSAQDIHYDLYEDSKLTPGKNPNPRALYQLMGIPRIVSEGLSS